jgi:excisionase family DNA binding protein
VTTSTSVPVLVSQLEAARLLGVERTTIRRMCRRGQLAKVCIGRRALITRASIDAFVAAQVRRAS